MTVETEHAEWRRTFPVVDAHTHYDPETLDDCLRFMDHVGLESMIELTPNYGEELDAKLDAIDAYPGRFGVFAGIDFDRFGEDGWIERECDRVTAAIDAGALGIKFWKDLGLHHTDQDGEVIPVDDERLAPIIETVGDCGGVVAFHIADPKAFFRPLTPENERWEQLQNSPEWWFGDRSEYPYGWWQLIRQLETIIDRHPDTTIMGAHFGCAAEEVGYVADVMRDHPNYIIDMSARLAEIGRHDPEKVRDIFIEFQDRILFGTDPILRTGHDWTVEEIEALYDDHWRYFETDDRGIEHPRPLQGDWTIDAIDLPRDVLRKVYGDNARRYFDL